MPMQRCQIALAAIALLNVGAKSTVDQFTPLIASALTTNAHPFLGTDGHLHIVYELVLTNTNATPATPHKIEVLDGSGSAKVLASYSGRELLSRLRTTGSAPVGNAVIEFNNSRLFLIDLKLDSTAAAPAQLVHHIEVSAAASPARKPVSPVSLSYTVAPLTISRSLPTIGPPLAGNRWVAINGCCGTDGVHRSSGLSVNGKIYFAQRFAIDWMRLDESGRLVHGDSSDVHSYPCYGADVLAVADGTVVEILDELTDQLPGTLPDPKTITLANVDGNHVVLDLGNGVFAFYAHLQKGSVRGALGRRVKRGQVLGKVGNTGNTSGPHLHFHLMESASVLGSNGLPYLTDSFSFTGQVSEAKFAAAPDAQGDWGTGFFAKPSNRRGQFPMNLNIVDFHPAK